jgi:uncharacterized membrane protein YgdD (TMEM256/DUF423 family)
MVLLARNGDDHAVKDVAERPLVLTGAVLGFIAVALGAFAAHALEPKLSPEALDWWQTAVKYHLAHAAATVAMGALAAKSFPGARSAGWLFAMGVLLFSGSLYVMALTGARWLGMVTPAGGVLMLAGWAALGWGAIAGGRR